MFSTPGRGVEYTGIGTENRGSQFVFSFRRRRLISLVTFLICIFCIIYLGLRCMKIPLFRSENGVQFKNSKITLQNPDQSNQFDVKVDSTKTLKNSNIRNENSSNLPVVSVQNSNGLSHEPVPVTGEININLANMIEFKPDIEWKEVPLDALLPAGCDIQIDLAKGTRQARWKDGIWPHGNQVVRSEPTEIERYIERAAGKDVSDRKEALEKLSNFAYQGEYGDAIMRSRNINLLFSMLKESKEVSVRLEVASLIAASLHNNKNAAEACLESILELSILCLSQERDLFVLRRLVAIITYVVETKPEDSCKKLDSLSALEVIEKHLLIRIKESVDPAFIERLLVLFDKLSLCQISNFEQVFRLTEKCLFLTSPNSIKEMGDVTKDSLCSLCQKFTDSKISLKSISQYCEIVKK